MVGTKVELEEISAWAQGIEAVHALIGHLFG